MRKGKRKGQGTLAKKLKKMKLKDKDNNPLSNVSSRKKEWGEEKKRNSKIKYYKNKSQKKASQR